MENIDNFQGGRLHQHFPFWEKITDDKQVLEYVNGVKIKFNKTPIQKWTLKPYKFSSELESKIDEKIDKFLMQNIVEFAEHEHDEFISNIFIKEKPDGDIRILINLTDLNEFIPDEHFKMEDVQTITQLIKQNCFMASVDFKDAYYCVKIDPKYRKYLRFFWKGRLMQFTCLPNGIKSAPRVFTKTTKPIFRKARENEATVSSYLDDSFIEGDNLKEARKNVITTVTICDKAGFIPHPLKSQLDPKQTLTHLGFVFNSVNMTIKVTEKRLQNILKKCDDILYKSKCKKKVTIREIASLSGCLVASFPGNQYGKLMHRTIDNYKVKLLKEFRGNFEAKAYVDKNTISEIKTCIKEMPKAFAPIVRAKPQILLESDSSDIGWGGLIKGNKLETGGCWSQQEIDYKNNYLELKAACFTIQSLCKNTKNVHIQIKSDNTTAVNYLNKQGGRKFRLNKLAKNIWTWAKQNKIWITAIYLPGKDNVRADRISRTRHSNLEWTINKQTFQEIIDKFGKPKIDLFASRLNNKLEKYISWKPDPKAVATDAFSVEWGKKFSYAFPPFNQIGKVIQKAIREKTKIIIVCPVWPTQPWYTIVTNMAKDKIIFSRNHIINPVGKENIKGELPKTDFMAVLIKP